MARSTHLCSASSRGTNEQAPDPADTADRYCRPAPEGGQSELPFLASSAFFALCRPCRSKRFVAFSIVIVETRPAVAFHVDAFRLCNGFASTTPGFVGGPAATSRRIGNGASGVPPSDE